MRLVTKGHASPRPNETSKATETAEPADRSEGGGRKGAHFPVADTVQFIADCRPRLFTE